MTVSEFEELLLSLELNTRCWTLLRQEGIYTIQELIRKTPFELLRAPNFGRGSLNVLEMALAKKGLSLSGGPATSSARCILYGDAGTIPEKPAACS
jgi:DNA-directed RNA polymerase alpha subunit